MACWNGDCDIINYLLSEGQIDVDAIDKVCNTCLSTINGLTHKTFKICMLTSEINLKNLFA